MPNVGQRCGDVLGQDGYSIGAVSHRTRHAKHDHHRYRDHGAATGHDVDETPRQPGEYQHRDLPNSQIQGQARGVRRVTNSSAAVGWIPTVRSKSALVAPIFNAMPSP